MRWQLVAIVVLLVVGLGAVGFAVFGPGLARRSASDYLTAQATRTDVTDQAVADGAISSSATYGLAFGSNPVIVSGSSSSGASGTWLVKSVSAKVGDAVTAGATLATADDSAAQVNLQLAQANLESAQARYTADSGGLSATDQQAAQLAVTQAQQNLTSAQQSRDETAQQNRLKLSQSEQSLSDAQKRLSDDRAANAPSSVITSDQDAVQSARDSLALVRAQVQSQNRQADDQVASAQLALDQANNGYDSKTAPATAQVLASDNASVLQAQQAVTNAQAQVDGATLTSPIDGIVVAVNLVVGTNAPSGSAIEVMSNDMQVTAEFAESDLPNLVVGQPATVAVAATGDSLNGTLSAISRVAATSAGSSVVSYAVTIALGTVPAAVLPGMSASIAVTIAQVQNVIAVPATALNGTAGSYTVVVLDASGQATTRQVDVGLVTTSLAEIKSGLTEGETVVTGTTSSLTTTSGGGLFFPGGGGRFQGGPGGGATNVQTAP